MPREDTAFDIGRAAGREIDHQAEPLAFVERLIRFGAARQHCERERGNDSSHLHGEAASPNLTALFHFGGFLMYSVTNALISGRTTSVRRTRAFRSPPVT